MRDINDSKILQHICQIWLKLTDLAKSAVSKDRKRLIESHQKQTNKQKLMFLSWSKVYHDMLAFCFLTQPEPICTKQGRNGKLSETFQTKSRWDLAHELSRSINWFYQNWFMCPNYFHSSNPFRCFFCLCLCDGHVISLMHVKCIWLPSDIKWNYTLTVQAGNNRWDIQVPEGKLFIGVSWTNFLLFLALQCRAICSH